MSFWYQFCLKLIKCVEFVLAKTFTVMNLASRLPPTVNDFSYKTHKGLSSSHWFKN